MSLIVLHAIWEHQGSAKLAIWAESSDLPVTTTRRNKKKQREIKPRQEHPFALSYEPLCGALSEVAGNLPAAALGTTSLLLQLPSGTHGPVSSPELLREEENVPGKLTFQGWEVPAYTIEAKSALDCLLTLPDVFVPGIALGGSLRFWTTAASFAFELLMRQCYTPTLQITYDANIRAAWKVVFAEDDAERMAKLAQMMPPVCWSALPPGEKRASLRQEMLLDFLNRTIDAFIRFSLSNTHSLLPSSKKAGKVTALPEKWLHGLATEHPEVTASTQELQTFVRPLQTWLAQVQPSEKNAAFRTCFRLDAPLEEDEEEDIVDAGASLEEDEEEDIVDTDASLEDSENQHNTNPDASLKENEDNTDSDTFLEEDEHEANWRVSFHLQANDDRSLLVPAEEVWRERSGTLTFLKRTFENPQERLLADLGKASRLFPALEESLKTARPAGLTLSAQEAYTFLREAAPLLEQSGFGVLVPPWWRKPKARLGVKMKIKPDDLASGRGLMGLEGIVAYDWTVSIGDMTLTASEFQRLVELKLPLIKVRGQWVELRPEEIERAIAFFQKKRRGSMTLGQALHASLGQELAEPGLPVVDIEGEGWVGDLLEQLSDGMKITPITPPATFQGQLRPYQLKGVSWMAFLAQFGLGGCLADSMGLGKTIELITLLLHHRENSTKEAPSIPTLLICPMSIVGNWQREMERFAPSLKVMVHHGHERLSGEAFLEEAHKHDMVITTYSLALRDHEHLAAQTWDYIVVDEAQNIKNETAKQTMAIRNLNARHRMALTGTPVENRLSELWSIMEFLNPGYLGPSTDFRQNFSIPIERYHNAEKAEVLKRIIQPFVLRRLKTDKTIIADLPEKLEMKVYCNLTQEQASLYEAVVKEMLEKIELASDIERKGLIFATLVRLKQICNHPAQYMADGSSLPGRSGKLARLEEMLEEVVESGEKALVFSQFAEMGTLLRRRLQEKLGCEVLFLHGGTPKAQRDLMVQRFQQEERRGPPIFLLSLKAGGVGLNLTAANHVFHFDRWWNPAVEDQATDRAFRIGQTRNVQVHKFVCVGTLEERIDQMIEQKKDLAENILGSGENWLTEMSTDQLKELFALSQEAVGE
jgi:SNF2 family DNA or RNA helicase